MFSKLRIFFTIAICKLARFAGKRIGRGSSLPGQIALKLYPQILQKLQYPEHIVAITGSNGKTSTVELIAHVLRHGGKTVAWNREGSNQIEGVTTFLLEDATLGGRLKSEVILLETDERFARHIFQHFKPTLYVITNLYRDQMTRNGHPEWIYEILRESITPEIPLLLNADDPLVSCFGVGHENVTYFGVDKLPFSHEHNTSLYHDGKYCPLCKAPLQYDYYHFNHIGGYRCSSCELKRHEPAFQVTDASLQDGYLVINGEHRISVSFSGIYHFYNLLAAYAVAAITGMESGAIIDSLQCYVPKIGRIVPFQIGEHPGTLLTSKHENSVSYDQSIRVALQDPGDFTVLIIIDAISRKYFTSETSWIWDIDFELFADPKAKKILLAGQYCNDLAVRFSYCKIPEEQIFIFEKITDAVSFLREEAVGHIYAITCFSDKGKLLALTEETS